MSVSEGLFEAFSILVKGLLVNADTPSPGSKAVREGLFDMERMAAIEMKVLLVVGGFDVDRGTNGAVSEVEIDIQEGNMLG